MPNGVLIPACDAIAVQLEAVLLPVIPDLQIGARRIVFPTPPTLDVFPPSDEFQADSGFGEDDTDVRLLVRARVGPVDNLGAQDALLMMMDPTASTSVRKALNANRTLGNTVQDLVCGVPDGQNGFVEPDGKAFLGCQWIVEVTL